MERRKLGRTGLEISVLGFGAGAVGGLMTKGAAADQERAIARAVDRGINYIDTASLYGNGESERNLGRVLKALKPNIVLGTKFRLKAADRSRVAAFIAQSMDESLKRLQRDHVDLFQLHNPLVARDADDHMDINIALNEVVPALQALVKAGKTRFVGFSGVGETPALLKAVEFKGFDTMQVVYNALNPSAGGAHAERRAGPGLRPRAGAHQGQRHGHDRDPGAGGRCAGGHQRTPSACHAGCRSDRLGTGFLRRR